MDHFRAADGSFSFPDALFPVVRGPPPVPRTVGERLRAVLDAAPPARMLPALLAADGGEPLATALSWAQTALRVADTWCDVPTPLLEAAIGLLRHGARAETAQGAQCALALAASPRVEKKRELLRHAAAHGAYRAWFVAGVGAPRAKALKRYERGARHGDAACLYALALASLYGLGREQNLVEAVRLLEQSALSADEAAPSAPFVLGKILLGEGGGACADGLNVPNADALPIDAARGLELVVRSAALGYAPALVRVGYAYNYGELPFDCAHALRYLALAAAQEVYALVRGTQPETQGAACVQIAKWFLCGCEPLLPTNEQWAFYFAEAGVQLGNATALFALGYFYETGTIVDKNLGRAANMYAQSAADGCDAARRRLEQAQFKDASESSSSEDVAAAHPANDARQASGPASGQTPTSTAKRAAFAAVPNVPPDTGALANSLNARLPYPSLSPVEPAQHPGQGRLPFLPYPDVDEVMSSGAEELDSLPYPATAASLPYPVSPVKEAGDELMDGLYSGDSTNMSVASVNSAGSSTPNTQASLGVPAGPYTGPPPLQGRTEAGKPPTAAMAQLSAGSSRTAAAYPVDSPTGPYLGQPSGPYEGPSVSYTGQQPLGPLAGPANGPSNGPSNEPSSGQSTFSGGIPPPAATAPGATVPAAVAASAAPFTSLPNGSTASVSSIATNGSSAFRALPRHAHSSSRSLPRPPYPIDDSDASASSSPSIRSVAPNLSAMAVPALGPTAVPPLGPLSGTENAPEGVLAPTPKSTPHSFSTDTPASAFGAATSTTSSAPGSPPKPHSLKSVSSGGSGRTRHSPAHSIDLGKARSASPLRKIFNVSTPQERADRSRAERRSFTQQALQDLQSAPKVPVHPISEQREPGVAYTFEEMGVKTYSSAKSNRCVIC